MRVVVGLSWPNQSAMRVTSTPACRRFMAAVWRSVCGVTFLSCSEEQVVDGRALSARTPVPHVLNDLALAENVIRPGQGRCQAISGSWTVRVSSPCAQPAEVRDDAASCCYDWRTS